METTDIWKASDIIIIIVHAIATIIDQQKELLLIKERVVQAEKDVESMRTTVQEAKLVVKQVEDFDSFLKTFDPKFKTLDREVNDIWEALDEVANPLN